jgi:fatty acid desaturase
LATAADPDRHRYGCFNKALHHELLGYLVGVTSFVRSARNVLWPRQEAAQLLDQADEMNQSAHEHRQYSWRDVAIILGWQLLLIVGLSAAVGPWAYIVLWVLPVYCCTFLADNLRSFLEHSQPEPDTDADSRRMISYSSNPIERLIIAPMNMNCHAAHHLWPSIPYYNLPQATREVRGHLLAAEIEWRKSYLGYLWRYMRALPLRRCKNSSEAVTHRINLRER